MADGLPKLDTDYNYSSAFNQGAAEGLMLRQAVQQNALANRRQQAMDELARTGDPATLMRVDPKVGLEMMSTLSKLSAEQRKEAVTRLEAGFKLFDLAEPHLRANPAHWPQFLEDAQQIGFDTRAFPQNFNSPQEFRGYLDQLKMGRLSVEDALKLQTPKIENIQQGDQNIPTAVYPGGRMVPVGAGGPKFQPHNPLERQSKDFEHEGKLRTEFNALAKDFRTVRDAFGTVKSLSERPSAAGDLGLVYSLMKMYDPGSVVRESEFAIAAATGGASDRVVASIQKVLNGERLTQSQRDDFVNAASKVYSMHEKNFNMLKGHYENLGRAYSLKSENVTQDFGLPAPNAPTGGGTGGGSKYNPSDLDAELRKRGLK